MALAATTLASDASATAQVFNLTSASTAGAAVGKWMKVNDEIMQISAVNTNAVTVKHRGAEGTFAKAHDTLSLVVCGDAKDFASFAPRQTQRIPDQWDIQNVGENQTLVVPKRHTMFVLNKGAALASTAIPDPALDQDGLMLQFLVKTDFAHVITFTSLHDGTTGAHTTATMAAFIGASLTVVAMGGDWLVQSSNLCTIT